MSSPGTSGGSDWNCENQWRSYDVRNGVGVVVNRGGMLMSNVDSALLRTMNMLCVDILSDILIQYSRQKKEYHGWTAK